LYEYVQANSIPNPTFKSEHKNVRPFGTSVTVTVNGRTFGPVDASNEKIGKHLASLLFLSTVYSQIELSKLTPVNPGVFPSMSNQNLKKADEGVGIVKTAPPAQIKVWKKPKKVEENHHAEKHRTIYQPSKGKTDIKNIRGTVEVNLDEKEEKESDSNATSVIKQLYYLGSDSLKDLLFRIKDNDGRVDGNIEINISRNCGLDQCMIKVDLKDSNEVCQTVTKLENSEPSLPKGGTLTSKGVGTSAEIARSIACAKMLRNLMPFYTSAVDMIRAIDGLALKQELKKKSQLDYVSEKKIE